MGRYVLAEGLEGWGEGRGKVDQSVVKTREDRPVVDWSREGGGARIWQAGSYPASLDWSIANYLEKQKRNFKGIRHP